VRFKLVLEITMIRRLAGSILPVTAGVPIPLRELFRKEIRKMTRIERRLEEEIEYQLFHRQAARRGHVIGLRYFRYHRFSSSLLLLIVHEFSLKVLWITYLIAIGSHAYTASSSR
jgi:hypothetical protein